MIDEMPYPIPSGWEWATLGDICQIVRTQIDPRLRSKDKFNYLSIENIESNSGELVDFTPTLGQKIRSPKIAFTTSDVLYSKLRPYLNKVHLPSFDGVSATDLIPIRPLGEIPREYVACFLRTRYVVEYANQKTRGIQLPRIPVDEVLNLPVPVSPLPEQERIVAKLGSSLKSIRIARKALVKVPSLLKVLRRSILAKAFRGELTERDLKDEPADKLLERIKQQRRSKWEDDLRAKGKDPKKYKYREPAPPDIAQLPALPGGWVWTNFDALLSDARYGTSQKCTAKAVGVPVLRIPNIVKGSLDLEDLKYSEFTNEETERLRVQVGDLLVCRTNGSLDLVGRSAVVGNRGHVFIFASYLIRLRPVLSEFLPDYLNLLLASPIGRNRIEGKARTTAGQYNVNLLTLRSLPVPLPPFGELKRIVGKVREQLGHAEEIQRAVEVAQDRVDTLEQSILAKAFRGELVPQDPNDEPASVLLERIRAQRAATGKKGRFQTQLELVSPAKTTSKA